MAGRGDSRWRGLPAALAAPVPGPEALRRAVVVTCAAVTFAALSVGFLALAVARGLVDFAPRVSCAPPPAAAAVRPPTSDDSERLGALLSYNFLQYDLGNREERRERAYEMMTPKLGRSFTSRIRIEDDIREIKKLSESEWELERVVVERGQDVVHVFGRRTVRSLVPTAAETGREETSALELIVEFVRDPAGRRPENGETGLQVSELRFKNHPLDERPAEEPRPSAPGGGDAGGVRLHAAARGAGWQ